MRVRARANISNFFTYSSQIIMWGFKTAAQRGFYMKNMILSQIQIIYNKYIYIYITRGVNVQPNPQTRHEPDMDFFGLGLDFNEFGS